MKFQGNTTLEEGDLASRSGSAGNVVTIVVTVRASHEPGAVLSPYMTIPLEPHRLYEEGIVLVHIL